jgi:hypothetical protein
MVESYGVTEENLAAQNLLAGSHPVVMIPIVLGSGAGDLAAGQVLGRKTSDNKYYKWTPAGADYTGEAIGSGDGSKKTFYGTFAHPSVVAGSVSITAQGTTETLTDNGQGDLVGDEGGSGSINYATGAFVVTFNSAPSSGTDNVYADYTGDVDGTEVPRAILARDTNADSEDAKTVAYVHGEFSQDAVDWNEAGDTQIAAAMRSLAELGIFVKKDQV